MSGILVTRTRIELVLPPWKGGVLTAWPTGHIYKQQSPGLEQGSTADCSAMCSLSKA